MPAKHIISFVLLVGFVSIAVFGFLGMVSDGHGHNRNCLAATARAIDCPIRSDKVFSLWFHLDAFKQFSQAVSGESSLALLLLAGFALFLYWGFHLRPSMKVSGIQFALERRKNFLPPLKNQYSSWLALRLNSPSFG